MVIFYVDLKNKIFTF